MLQENLIYANTNNSSGNNFQPFFMKKNLRILFFVCSAVFIFSACHKKVPKQTLYIPKDATFVLGADPESLAGKLQDSHFNMDSLFKTFGDTSTASQVGIKNWDDLKNSGLDWQSEIFVFASSSGSVMSGQSTSTGAVAAMKDDNAFEVFIKKSYPSAAIKKAGNFSYAFLKNGFAIGWNTDVAVLSNVISYNASDSSGLSTNNTASEKQLEALFAQKEDASVASLPQFKEVADKKADMIFFNNANSIISSIPFIGMTKAADLLKDAYTAGTINFEDGKAKMEVKSYTGKDLQDILSKYAGPTVNMDMVDKYPSQVEGYTLFSFNPQIIASIIKYVGVDGTVNQFLQQVGLNMDDILKAFKGDFGIVFSDFGVTSQPNEFSPGDTIKKPTIKLVVNAAIGDKASYDKVVAVLAQKGMMVQQNGQYVFPQMNGFSMSADDKNLILASDMNLLNAYKSGSSGKSNVPDDIEKKSKGNAIAMYFDLAAFLKTIPVTTPEATATLTSAQQTFKDFIATSTNYDGKTVNGYVEIHTVNDKENSLVSFVKFSTAAAAQAKAIQNEFTPRAGVKTDSTGAPQSNQ